MTDTPRIYVASLSDYNAGRLHGVWIDANRSAEEIAEEVDRMLEDSKEPNIIVRIGVCQSCDLRFRLQVHDPNKPPELVCPECDSGNVHKGDLTSSAEEWAIHDYEGFGDLNIGEYESFDTIADLAALIEEHGPAYAAYAGNVGLDYANAEDFEEAYNGEWRSEEEFGERLVEDLGIIEDGSTLAMYFDYEKFARDLFMGDYYSVDGGIGVYVFRSI